MTNACLSDELLRGVANGTASGAEHQQAEQHLDHCVHCRARLEQVAGPTPELLAWRDGDQAAHPQPGPGLARVMDQFREASRPISPATQGPSVPEADITRLFEPARRPGSLGHYCGYDILEVVAAGGMGIVLRAIEPSLERVVALKLLAPSLAHDPSARERFLREARATAAIRHDHVVVIHAVGDGKPLPFLAMEYVEGDTLATRLNRDGPLPFPEILRLARELGEGLGAAHARGIVHRDVKPGNVLLERGTGRAKLTDFGLACAADDTSLTRSGYIVGTPEYLSPEQAGGESVDHRSDLFSLGCLLYAAATGHSPFRASTALGVLRRVAEHVPGLLTESHPGIPRWFDTLVQRLLAKAPQARFQSAADFVAALESRTPQAAPVLDPVEAPRGRMLAAAGLVLVALVGCAVILLATRGRKPSAGVARFILEPGGGASARTFSDLAAASSAATTGATVSLAWNGAVEVAPIRLPPKALNLRGAPGFAPIWQHRHPDQPAITATAAITLDGIEFQLAPDGTPHSTGPTTPALLELSGGPVDLRGCRLVQGATMQNLAVAWTGLRVQGVGEGRIADTALLLRMGTAIECPEGVGFLDISNTVIFAENGLTFFKAHETNTVVRLSRTSWKGGTALYFSRQLERRFAIHSRSNLFNTASVIVSSAGPLRSWVEWNDCNCLFALARLGDPQCRYIRHENQPNQGPPNLRAWRNNFAREVCTQSYEARARFTALRPPDDSAVAAIPTLMEFRIASLERVEGSPLPSRETWESFGADLASIGPGRGAIPPSR